MLIEVSNEESEAIKYACSMNNLHYTIFETEISGIVKVRIRDCGRELSAPMAYRLKGHVDEYMRIRQEREIDGRSMDDLKLPEETPLNVLMLIEDLPR